MRAFLTILAILPILTWGQQTFDTIYTANYVSNPPKSEAMCDTHRCEGSCISYYKTGQVHIKGKFEKGQPVDTLFTFFPNGVIQELAIPVKDGWKIQMYYDNGQLKANYNYPKGSITKYYVSGNLMVKETWNRRFKRKVKKHDENGTLVYKETFNKQNTYDSTGVLRKSIRRREIFRLQRMRSRERPFFKFTWHTYNSNGEHSRIITFSESEFPEKLYEIDDFLFDEIIFFKNGQYHKKIVIKSEVIDNNYTRYFVLYICYDGEWKKDKEIPLEGIHNLIETLSIDYDN